MQAQHGLSIEAQESQIRGYCKLYGYELIEIFIDRISGKSTQARPDYRRMISGIDKGKATFIICTSLDRLSRSQKDFLSFQQDYINAGRAHVVFINQGINTEQIASKQVLPLIVAFAQLEHERASERVTGIIRYIRSQGGHFGRVGFGYMTQRDGRIKRLTKHPENYAWVEKMAALYRAGASFFEIAQFLNENGVRACQSETWTKTSVYNLLVKERIHIIRSERGSRVYDRDRAFNLAYVLREDGNTYTSIADKLNEHGLRPGKASEYRWWSVQELLRSAIRHDLSTAAGCARYWKAKGYSLRAIALKLQGSGHTPKRGGQWYAQQVKQLLLA